MAGPPLFVAFEGGDGAGKSTQIRRLRGWLAAQGRSVVVTREPGGTALGSALRDLVLHGGGVSPRAEALLFAADRAQHVQEVIRPALDRGDDVLTDRYLDSSVAYQGAGRDLSAQEVRDLSLWATAGLLPDLTVLLDLPPALARGRRGEVPDRMESEPDDFHERVRQGFLRLAAAEPERYVVADASLPEEQVAALVAAAAAERIGIPV